ncbi:MAG: hypothetical protein U5K69_26415 [Balneolaceae bacterium]|nr:hypothetical protein [Balneolaceae bacterium]
MKEIDLNKRGMEVGNITRGRLEKLQSQCSQIGDVRGNGGDVGH